MNIRLQRINKNLFVFEVMEVRLYINYFVEENAHNLI